MCLPTDLVSEIEVDISGIKEYGDNIKIGDLALPEGMEFITSPDEIIAVVNEPVSEEEEALAEGEGAEAGEVEGEEVKADDDKPAGEETKEEEKTE